jgi:5-amino-6-(5-phosphoribosylamino)uracil reductase
VYCPASATAKVRHHLGDLTEVCGLGENLDLSAMLDDLASRGIRRLMVEGGGTIHTQFLQADLADEIQLAVAPFLLGEQAAPRFVNPGIFPDGPRRRMRLEEVLVVGDVAVLRYMPARTQ